MLFWEFLLADFFEGHTVKSSLQENVNMGLIAGGNVIMIFVYGKLARRHHSAKEGFQYGVRTRVFIGP